MIKSMHRTTAANILAKKFGKAAVDAFCGQHNEYVTALQLEMFIAGWMTKISQAA